MSDCEHLVENVFSYVEKVGWNKFSDFPTDDEIEGLEYLLENGNEKISRETLKWLIAMACYVIYQKEVFGD